jgi:hypothetical protein
MITIESLYEGLRFKDDIYIYELRDRDIDSFAILNITAGRILGRSYFNHIIEILASTNYIVIKEKLTYKEEL